MQNGSLWDNVGGYFEKYEIDGYASYRVMKRSLPTKYAITSIETGYYVDGDWIWREFFRLIYAFTEDSLG